MLDNHHWEKNLWDWALKWWVLWLLKIPGVVCKISQPRFWEAHDARCQGFGDGGGVGGIIPMCGKNIIWYLDAPRPVLLQNIVKWAFGKSKTNISGKRPTYFIVIRGHNILEVIKKLFATACWYSLLWPKTTTINKSQKRYSLPEASIGLPDCLNSDIDNLN